MSFPDERDDVPGRWPLDLERVAQLLRPINPSTGKARQGESFDPERDREAFCRHLIDIGCRPPAPRADR